MALPALAAIGRVAIQAGTAAARGAATAGKAVASTGRGLAQAGKNMGSSFTRLSKGSSGPKLKTTKIKSFAREQIQSRAKNRLSSKLSDKDKERSKKKLGKEEEDNKKDNKKDDEKKSQVDSSNEDEKNDNIETDQTDTQEQEGANNPPRSQQVVEKIKVADSRLPILEQIKINVTNIHQFLVSQNKKRAEAKKITDRRSKRDQSEGQFEKEEKKLEFSPFGGSKIKNEIPKPTGGNIFQKLFEFIGLILLGIFVNALPAIIEGVKGIIDSIVNFITPIMSGFNLIKDFFTGEVDRKGSDADKKRVDDSLKGISEDGGLIDQIAEKLGPLGAVVKMLKPLVEMFRKSTHGGKVVKSKKDGREGFLNKETGEFTPKEWTSEERDEYYSPGGSLPGGPSGDGTGDDTSGGGGTVVSRGSLGGFPITSDYGWRWGKLHGGLDIGTPTGTAVAIDKPGEVLYSAVYGGYGNMIDAWVPSLNIQFRFAHLVKRFKKRGDKFNANEVIGKTGGGANDPGRGSSTGPHLHLEVDTRRGSSEYGGAKNRGLLHRMSQHIKLGSVSSSPSSGKGGGQFSKKIDAMDPLATISEHSSENVTYNFIIKQNEIIHTRVLYV